MRSGMSAQKVSIHPADWVDDFLDWSDDSSDSISEDSSSTFSITAQDDVYMNRAEILSHIRNSQPDESERRRRDGSPTIKHIVPDRGSINGGQIITIAGWNLKSQKFNVGTETSDTSTEDEGDDFNIWFEYDGQPNMYCVIDRHFR
jgi:hypothetical protein